MPIVVRRRELFRNSQSWVEGAKKKFAAQSGREPPLASFFRRRGGAIKQARPAQK